MYLTYETYVLLGNGSVSAEDFPSVEAWAEALLDNMTLGRLQVVDWSTWQEKVQLVMAYLVDRKAAIEDAEQGAPLSSFSNGSDNFSFAEPTQNQELVAALAYVQTLLPVDLVSTCTSYNEATA